MRAAEKSSLADLEERRTFAGDHEKLSHDDDKATLLGSARIHFLATAPFTDTARFHHPFPSLRRYLPHCLDTTFVATTTPTTTSENTVPAPETAPAKGTQEPADTTNAAAVQSPEAVERERLLAVQASHRK